MRLLALVTDGYGAAGGIARYNCDLMNALSHSVHINEVVILPRFGDSKAARPKKIVQFNALSSAYRWAAKAAYLALRGGYDAIFCGHLNAAPFVTSIARPTGKPIWVQTHGIEAWTDRGAQFRRALANAQIVTSVSRHTRRRLLSWSDIPPSLVRVLPNTFDPNYTSYVNTEDLKARYGLKNNKVVLTVGRMSSSERYKGHDRIIRCLEAVRSVVPEVVYLIVGTGDDQPRLKALAQELGVQDAVLFSGYVAADEIVSYYALADVFAMPSTGEGFGIVFLEAAAAGLPVIGGRQDGSIDALADGAIGTLIEPDDYNALVGALVLALREDSAAPRDAIRRFAFSNFCHHVDDIVKSIKS